MPSGAVAMRRGRLPLPVATSVILPVPGSRRPMLSPYSRQNQMLPFVFFFFLYLFFFFFFYNKKAGHEISRPAYHYKKNNF